MLILVMADLQYTSLDVSYWLLLQAQQKLSEL